MSCLFRKIMEYITSSKKKVDVKPHVTFTTSTLRKERERKMRNIASPVPFKNFVNELSLIVMDQKGKDRLTIKESASIRKMAVRMWRHLDQNFKNRYRQMAMEARDARAAKCCLKEEKSTLEVNVQVAPSVQKLGLAEVDDLRSKPKRRRSATKITSVYDKGKRPTAKVAKKCINRESVDSAVSEASSSIRISLKRRYPSQSDRKKEDFEVTPSSDRLLQEHGCCERSLLPPDEKNPKLNSYSNQEDLK